MTILSQLTVAGVVGLSLPAVLTAVYLFSADSARRARAMRVLRLLLRR
ncbi:hypothetical protein AB0C10_02350 [Microbispora amethystogenes]|uniref:Uncharacterized protein n=1 Tax=Microbispora amethystogenes TaxID=1427754 RepID=A0ABQ4F7V9_9ACTN|nr:MULTISPECIES: hypothetical protein [Microbispora]GIH30863.1 hypothetical protein Mam01_10270 [Microbispora amethystogenes]